ncbi:hypothetical protein [Pyxidicoccus sp. MSG2]|uniref:hypothetical protein n=1 Tax=Pyxidicoccus sp. MSG2 TaxID=2996790 RepID=UPI00226EDBFE|nr:hypothetical protein [Pyxidicoccus sp. MSG2]MCY1019124.1 hypothetical protein [Pyxidicoccus sp. MSG2]
MNKWTTLSMYGAMAVMLAVATAAQAGPVDDLTSRKSDWDSTRRKMEDVTNRVEAYIQRSRKLREMDKNELAELITQICRLDVEPNEDEANRLAQSLRDKVQENVKREYDSVNSEADKLEDDAERLLNDAKALLNNVKSLTSTDEVKDESNKLVSELSNAIDRYTERAWQRLNDDYKTLDNVKNGVMNGSNNPKVRAAMEYGKEKHLYNQRICEEKELSLSSGRPDCVSFQKDACVVWEFKPDTYSESDAKSQAERYLSDVTYKFKDDRRAVENCKKNSDGQPIFEARGVTYPACRLSSL